MRTTLTLGLLAAGVVTASAQETVNVIGSDTLGAKLVPAWSRAFKDAGNNVNFDIKDPGSSAAFTGLLNGTANLGMSSREAKEKEITEARAAGNELVQTTVVRDVICVIVNENSPIEELTLDQVKGIFTGKITDWSELEGTPGEIAAYTRNTTSGTYKSFQKLAMAKEEYGDNTQKMAGNQEIADEVADNESGIGYVGKAYAGTEGVKIIKVGGNAPDDAGYPIGRDCYFYTNGKPTGIVAKFIEFCLSDEGDKITEELNFLPVK